MYPELFPASRGAQQGIAVSTFSIQLGQIRLNTCKTLKNVHKILITITTPPIGSNEKKKRIGVTYRINAQYVAHVTMSAGAVNCRRMHHRYYTCWKLALRPSGGPSI